MSRKILTLCLFCLAVSLTCVALSTQPVYAGGAIYYVTPNGSGSGSSWADAASLQTALGSATSGAEIWVASGVYTPGVGRSDTFTLAAGVRVYGGFAGNETDCTQRDPATHVTVLSGDIDHNDDTDANGVVTDTAHIHGSNAYHVVTANAAGTPITGTTVLDGFTITGGQANGGSFPDYTGGGFLCKANLECSPSLNNLIFSGNMAVQGGAIYNSADSSTSNPSLTNVIFFGNVATGAGGALFNDAGDFGHSSPSLTNVTFFSNTAGNAGGALFNDGENGGDSSPVLRNVILWGNSAPSGSELYNYFATSTISTSLVQGSVTGSGITNDNSSVTDGGGNLDADPLFVDAAAGNLRLRQDSPAIDVGANAAISLTTDLDGLPRRVDGDWDGTTTVDMGAYEFQPPCPSGSRLYVDKTASTPYQGDSWSHAFPHLQSALAAAAICSAVDEIWVAGGVYTPGVTISDTFTLPAGVGVYGGFAGGETLRTQRDPATHVTVLSGDIGGDDDTDANGVVTDTAHIHGSNAYHVVSAGGTATPITGTTVLDGFTITGGQANAGTFPDNAGGGFFCNGEFSGHVCSPSLSHLIFSANTAGGGGALYNGGYEGVSSPSLTNVTFFSNFAYYGGAVYNDGYEGVSSPSLTNVTFFSNRASSNGGALYNYGFQGVSSPSLTNITFFSNRASSNGGALYNDARRFRSQQPQPDQRHLLQQYGRQCRRRTLQRWRKRRDRQPCAAQRYPVGEYCRRQRQSGVQRLGRPDHRHEPNPRGRPRQRHRQQQQCDRRRRQSGRRPPLRGRRRRQPAPAAGLPRHRRRR